MLRALQAFHGMGDLAEVWSEAAAAEPATVGRLHWQVNADRMVARIKAKRGE